MLEAIVCSDWHLGGFQKHFTDAVERQLYEVDKIYKYAVSKGIQHVIVAGDISNTPHMDYNTYIQLVLFLKKYDGIVNTYYIAGNHDFSDVKRTSMDLLNVLSENSFFETFKLFLQPEDIVIDDCPVFMAPYPCCETSNNSPKLNIAHVTYTGAVGDNGRKLKASDEFKQFKGDYTVSGHIHLYQQLKSKRAVYCGNPYQKTFGESLPKGFIHIKARVKGNNLEFKHKFINNHPDFQLVNLHIKDSRDFSKLTDSDSVRYKLWIYEGVNIPKDLRTRFPNITGGIFDNSSKLINNSNEVTLNANTSVNIVKGLGKFFKTNGFTRKQYDEAKTILSQARNELGI